MISAGIERKLTTILSADVQGFSRLMGEDEEATLRTLQAYRAVTDSLIHQHRGRIVGTAGDSILAEFASVIDAVRCAVEIQQQLKARNADLPVHRRMEFRIGINLGDVMVDGEQIYGDGVNIAARLQALADAGGIYISGTVYDQVKNKLGLRYEDLGEQTVKNIAEPVRAWRVVMDEAAVALAEQVVQRQPPVETPRRGVSTLLAGVKPRRLAGIMASVLFIAATIVVVRYLSHSALSPQDSALRTDAAPAALPLPDKPSIVVLPFSNMSGDPQQEYFSDGITEVLTSDLSRISSLFVIARNTAFTYKGKAANVQDVGRELGVRYVLEGSVQKAGEQVRIVAQLIDTTTGGHLWSERYDRPLKDIFALQDEIVQKIVTTLKLQLALWERGILVRKTTDNLEAYDYYLRGIEYSLRSPPTKEANVQARQLFEKAIELDPAYMEAYARVSITYWWEWLAQWSQDPQTLERAFTLAQKAIALNDALPVAHIVLGLVYQSKRQYDQAIAEATRAITLDPNGAGSYLWLGVFLASAGRPQEAIGLIEKAMRLNPRYPALYLNNLGFAYHLMGRYEEAIAIYKSALSRDPYFFAAHFNLAAAYGELGREAEAQAEVVEILRVIPHFSLEAFSQRVLIKDPERYLAALRKAGLK